MINEADAKRAKKQNLIIAAVFASIFAVVILASVILLVGYKLEHTYTYKKWIEHPAERHKFVGSMLKKHDIVGMTETEVIHLLGNEDSDISSFKMSDKTFPPEDTLVYFIGVDYPDTRWLIISLDDGIVTQYLFDIT